MQIDETSIKSNDSHHSNGNLNLDENESTSPEQNNQNCNEEEHVKTINANGIRSNLINHEN
jgi:hypothetical protein